MMIGNNGRLCGYTRNKCLEKTITECSDLGKIDTCNNINTLGGSRILLLNGKSDENRRSFEVKIKIKIG
jgi:hypothetical protein